MGRQLRSRLLLQLLMKQKGHSTNTLGPAAGISRQMAAHLASGRRRGCRDETAQALAAALGVSVDDLFLPAVSDESSTKE